MSATSRLKRGFTLVELMIVVAIVGVLAALAIYGVRKYIANAKTAEARNSIGQMGKDASTAYAREGMDAKILDPGKSTGVINRLCDSVGGADRVPGDPAKIAGKKYQSSPVDWNKGDSDTGWRCLKFSMTDPQYFMYNYTRAGGDEGSFTCSANGNLNGDAVLSTFTLKGEVKTVGGTKEVFVSPTIEEVLPEE